MTQDQFRLGLADLLQRLKDQDKLEGIPQSSHQVQQLLELAYENVERTRFLLQQRPDYYDWQIATLWDAMIEASKAALASQKFRIKGAEGTRFELTRAAAYILAPEDAEWAKAMFDLTAGWLNLRNQIKYDRQGVVSRATRDDIVGKAGPILQALSVVSHAAVGSVPDFDDWNLAVS